MPMSRVRYLVLPVVVVLVSAVVTGGCAAKKMAASGAPATPNAAPAKTVPAPAAATPAIAPVAAAAASVGPAPAARPPAPAPLVGHVTRTAVEDYETWRSLRAQDYTPAPDAVKTIGERWRDAEVLLVLATWCPDSKREVPRFFKILDQAGVGLDKVTMVAVDRSKKDAEGLTDKHQVQRVPTFVFIKNGQEIGRVTEKPVSTLEGEIAAIVAKSSSRQ
jgi:thiol-disulfide isomerase/thioredoxin